MAKKSLTQTEYADLVVKVLQDEYEYGEEDFTRNDVIRCLKAAAQVSIENASRQNGCQVIGIGKLRLHKRPETKKRMGRNPATGEEIVIQPKPARFVPKFRMSKSCKDACLSLVEDQNKALAKKFKSKKKSK